VSVNQRAETEMKSRVTPGESIILVSQCRLPKTYTNATSFFGVIALLRMFDEMRNLFILRRVREQSQSLSFPVERRMTVCVTEHRLLIWRVKRFSKSIHYLGDVPRARVRRAHKPYVSHGSWEIVVIETTEGHSIHLWIDAASSDAFERLFTSAP
jgi:hypothetical protein